MAFIKIPVNNRPTAEAKIDEMLQRLRLITENLTEIKERVDLIEKVLIERLPPDILTERKFAEEVEGGDEIVNKIMSKVEELIDVNSMKTMIEDKLDGKLGLKPSPVEVKKIERITELLQKNGRLTSKDLAKLTGLSRTRCNEYFKQMETLGIVEPVDIGKQKFYRLT